MGTVFSPLDEQLELVRYQRLTPWLAECVVRLGTELPFERAREELRFQQGVEVSRELIRRHTEVAGAVYAQLQAETSSQTLGSVAAQWTVERAGERMMVSVDAAKVQTVSGEWRDVKTMTVAEVRADGSTRRPSYFSRVSEYTQFAQEARLEAQRRCLRHSAAVCAVNDGAEWIGHVVAACRPDAVRILDFYHAMQHLATAGQAVFGAQHETSQAWLSQVRKHLLEESPEAVLQTLAELAATHKEHAEVIGQTQAYLLKRLDQIEYRRFLAAGWPIGSGSGEAAHKVVIQARMKRGGMRWQVKNINALAALRNMACNQRWHCDWSVVVQAQRRLASAKTSRQRCHAPRRTIL